MKLNKFFAVAMAALTMVAFSACERPGTEPGTDPGTEPGTETELALDQTSVTLEIGATVTLNATVEATWASSNPAVATVEGTGKTAVVTAVAEGNAVITASTTGGQTKTCVVLVKKATSGGGEGGAEVKGSQVWPIIMDGVTYTANESKIVASFQPNDVDQFLYVWDNTYLGNENPTGLNFAGNSEGYTALTVNNIGWSGAGYCLTEAGTGWQAAEALRAAIVANPDEYFLHIAIKSTDNASHTFYIMNTDQTKFVLGNTVFDGGTIYGDFARDGAWHEFDIPMSTYAATLASTTFPAGGNLFVMLSGGTSGVQLNLDAVYFYKK